MAINDPLALATLVSLATNPDADGHMQSWWALEIVAEESICLVEPYLPQLIGTMPKLIRDGAIRSASKICMIFCRQVLESLPDAALSDIRDICLEWLTGDSKVAAKAYSARALFEIAKFDALLLRELEEIVSVGFGTYSAAYKAMARDLIGKIARLKS